LTEREAYARRLKETPLAAEPPVALSLARTVQPDAVNPDLARAYDALRNGDYEQARALYLRRVQAEPLSLDAQLGLATVGARTGDRALANRHYRDALSIDPRNEVAIAGLLAIAGAGSPGNQETQLRTMLGQNPGASSLHFSLGNLLAAQSRWVEAQQAYFEAYRLHADVADHAYNLAVSLDHLGQGRLARDYYLKALELQPRSKGQFDTAVVAKRVQELTGSDKAP
jgi:Tfp pilus assembly protein PilF